ncbi:hypothetical protein E8E12_008130 [Didymella heteroderae]|uniref:Apple domain-containing protein n=1 Tax=Didymella heteroderae TaxID=1769908 RepID=A0A9P4WVZ0_9PLEO|nr:hypothetical protein E8E12_008130 [Didymella heteroderae]
MYFISALAVAAALAGSAIAAPGDCRPLRGSSAPGPLPNTPEDFASFAYFDDVANSSTAPANYEAFMVAGHAAVHGDAHYVTYRRLSSYDVGACAKACDGLKECASFNIYFQRYPTVAPGPACPNPEAKVVVRCALFRSPMSAGQATNYGQLRGPADADDERFEVLMRGSNAYNRLVSPVGRVTATSTVTSVTTATVTNTVFPIVRA